MKHSNEAQTLVIIDGKITLRIYWSEPKLLTVIVERGERDVWSLDCDIIEGAKAHAKEIKGRLAEDHVKIGKKIVSLIAEYIKG